MKVIFFDVGDTLVGAPSLYDEIVTKLKIVEKEFFIKEFEKKRKASSFCTVKECLVFAIEKINKDYKKSYDSSAGAIIYDQLYTKKSFLFVDVKKILTNLIKKGYILVVVSDADAETLLEELKNLGILPFFSKVYISSEVKAYKPSLIFADKIKKELNYTKGKSFFVGDSVVDFEMAKKLGVKSIIIKSSVTEKILPDFFIKDISDLTNILNI